ncbi:hypothetical protein TB1_043063 [Malus domestica]
MWISGMAKSVSRLIRGSLTANSGSWSWDFDRIRRRIRNQIVAVSGKKKAEMKELQSKQTLRRLRSLSL